MGANNEPARRTGLTRSARHLMRIGIVALACLTSPLAHADHCAAYARTNLNVLLDLSGSMQTPAWKFPAAQSFTLEVIDTISAAGRLNALGGIGFPTLPSPPGFDVRVDPANIATVRDHIANIATGDLSGANTPLYGAIVVGSGHLEGMSGGANRLMIVVTDGQNSGAGPTAASAAIALASSGATTYLVFVGERDAPGEAELAALAADANRRVADFRSGSRIEYRLADNAAALDLAASVLTAACESWAPDLNVRVSPNPLVLGVDGVDMTFDASATTDRDTPVSQLDYAWRLIDPAGNSVPAHSGVGSAGARFIRAFASADIGRWQVAVEVSDRAGGRHEQRIDLEIDHARPVVDITDFTRVTAGETMRFSQNTLTDLDGGELTVQWEVTSAPADARFGVGHVWSRASVEFDTDSDDISLFSNDTRRADRWCFRLTLTDDEGAEVTDGFCGEVVNAVPELSLAASITVNVGESLELGSDSLADPDGGGLHYVWDLIQGPDSSATAVGREVSNAALFTLPTDREDAGTWIVRQLVVDDEGEGVEARASILVDGAPRVVIGAPTPTDIGAPLVLSGMESVDPDTPCGRPDFCHTNIEGPVTDISPGIATWEWSLVDVPIQSRYLAPYGSADELFGIDTSRARIEIPTAGLTPGEWGFQLTIRDGEGNVAGEEARAQLRGARQSPIAAASGPQRVDMDAGGRTLGAAQMSATGSYDPDDAGDPPLAANGIDAYRWEVLSGPAGCGVLEARTGDTENWTFIAAREALPATCHGSWLLGVTVTDDEGDTDTAEARVSVGSCASGVCIDFPTSTFPAMIEQSARTDVAIIYHVDSALFGNTAQFPFGTVVRLDIFRQGDDAGPVYTAFDSGLTSAGITVGREFYWSGHHGAFAPRRGMYDVRISLLDHTGTTLLSATETGAIAISGGDPLFDCGDLWVRGFPDARFGGAFPCVPYTPDGIGAAGLEMYYPAGWLDSAPERELLLRWAHEAAAETTRTLAAYWTPPPRQFIAMTSLSGGEAEGVDGIAFLGHPAPGEPCPIVIYDTPDWTEDRIRFVVAHEVAHCFQWQNTALAGGPWEEGAADYMANLVYPTINAEHAYMDRAGSPLELAPDQPLLLQEYATAAFFQHLANYPGVGLGALFDLFTRAASGAVDAGDAFISTPEMPAALHGFGQALVAHKFRNTFGPTYAARVTRGIADDGGGIYPPPGADPRFEIFFEADGRLRAQFFPGDGETRERPKPFIIEAETLSVQAGRVFLAPGTVYDLRIAHDPRESRLSWLRWLGTGTADWQDLPARLVTECAGGDPGNTLWHYVFTSTSPPGTTAAFELDFTATPNPACD